MAVLLKLLIITLFGLSAWWEISLFVSIAGTAMHALQIGTFAVCLVAGQLLFADQAALKWKQGQKALALAAGAVVVTLMFISVNGNALYFETQFQATHRQETVSDDGYQLILDDIASTQAERKRYLALEETERLAGNKWMAGQHLKQATAAGETLARLRAELKASKATASKTGTAGVLDQAVGAGRTGLFYLLSLLTDLLPVLALVLLRNQPDEIAGQTDKQNSEQPSEQPHRPTEQTAEQPAEKQADGQPDSLWAVIEESGTMPSWSQLKASGWTYTRYKRERDQLEQAGRIRQEGQGFVVCKERDLKIA